MLTGVTVMVIYIGVWIYSILKRKAPKNLIANKDAITSTTGFIEYTGTPPRTRIYPPRVVNKVKVH